MQRVVRRFSTTRPVQIIGKFNKQLAATKPKEHVVKQLTRPIGFEKPPNDSDNRGDLRTVREKFSDFMDREKNRQRQAELEREISKSGMYDVYTFRKTGGKFFTSPPAYWKAEKALYFPNFVGETLKSGVPNGTTSTICGHVTIVRVFTSLTGDKSSRGFFQTSEGNYMTPDGYSRFRELYPHAQIVDINVTENAIKALFIKMSKAGLRKQLHQDRHDKYFIVPRKTLSLDLREAIHMDNTYGGFVYVLDHNGKIRWAVCGEADEKDKAVLWRTVRGLQREYRALNQQEIKIEE
jgi:ATPase complex subunit ATP10